METENSRAGIIADDEKTLRKMGYSQELARRMSGFSNFAISFSIICILAWTEPGPWTMGVWYRPLAVLAIIGCGGLIVIGMQPPNQQAAWIIGGVLAAMVVIWFSFERKRFAGPPPRALAAR